VEYNILNFLGFYVQFFVPPAQSNLFTNFTGTKIGHKIELNEAVSLKPSIRTFYFFLFHKSSFSQKKSCKNNYFPYKSKILLLFLLPYSLVSITIPQTYFIKNRNFALFSNLQNEAEVVFYQSILGLVQLQS